jgi:alginate O-acetyltransferase complex protein AlgJ
VRRSVFIFVAAVLLGLLVVPTAHLVSAPGRETVKWRKTFLYNTDFVSRWMARLLYPFGISTDPGQVIVGRDGWLFLGDQHDQTRTVDRRPPTDEDFRRGRQIGNAAQAWDAYLARKDVKLFRVLVGPNKGTIYPEHLPIWSKPSSPNATDALLAGTGQVIYIDPRGSLLAAKARQASTLYYRTDTHWNLSGAGIAFQTFAEQVGKDAPEIRWPSPDAYQIARTDPRLGGDLTTFLRLQSHFSDVEPVIQAFTWPIATMQVDYDSQRILSQGGNPMLSTPQKPLLVRSPDALNSKKVLWLRDSFGNALSPLMAVTFSDVIQINWSEAMKPAGRLLQLIDEWRPDYVFVTIVERAARAPEFTALPP